MYDVEEKAKAGNGYAKRVLESWANAEWFTSKDKVSEKITVTVFKVTGETNTDDLSPAPDAWSRPDIPLHALAMLKISRDGINPDAEGSVGIRVLQNSSGMHRGRGRVRAAYCEGAGGLRDA